MCKKTLGRITETEAEPFERDNNVSSADVADGTALALGRGVNATPFDICYSFRLMGRFETL